MEITLSADASFTKIEWENNCRKMEIQHNMPALWESLTAEYIHIKIKTVPLHGEKKQTES